MERNYSTIKQQKKFIDKNNEKTFRDLGYKIMWDKLELKEIKQDLYWYERRKVAPTLENHTGSW